MESRITFSASSSSYLTTHWVRSCRSLTYRDRDKSVCPGCFVEEEDKFDRESLDRWMDDGGLVG